MPNHGLHTTLNIWVLRVFWFFDCLQVYRGKNQETDEVVAIKEISWLVIRRRSPEFIARHSQNLRNETDILQSLDHPNIVKLLGETPADLVSHSSEIFNFDNHCDRS